MSSQILSYKKKSKILKSNLLKKIETISQIIQHALQKQNSSSENQEFDFKFDVLENEVDELTNKNTHNNTGQEDWCKKNEINNSFFFHDFNLEKLIQEVESVPWTTSRPLDYYSYSLKNLISVKDEHVTGGSKTLEHYVSPYSSTIYKSLKNSGAINLFNSNLDEFGMSGTGLDSAFGNIPNPYSDKHIIGGSSSGSAYVVANDFVDFSIGSDTGDSGRIPASNSNVFGFKPSYGSVSRFGFFPFCSHFDTPAIFSKCLETITNVMSVISHPDPKDLSTINTKHDDYSKYLNKEFKNKIKIVIFKETFDIHPNSNEDVTNTKKEFSKMIAILQKDKNFEICEISFEPELLKLFSLVYVIISYSESISNYSNINGLLFPFAKTIQSTNPETKTENINKQENTEEKIKPIFLDKSSNFKNLLINSRKSFGKEFKFRQLMGMYFLDGKNYDEIYLQAKKLLTVINDKVTALFENYDAVLSPTTTHIADNIENVNKKYNPSNIQNILLMANFCGLPAISIPWIFDKNLPIGLHACCGYKKDGLLFQITNQISKHINNQSIVNTNTSNTNTTESNDSKSINDVSKSTPKDVTENNKTEIIQKNI